MHLKFENEKEVCQLNNLLLSEIYRLEEMLRSVKQQMKIRKQLNYDNSPYFLDLEEQSNVLESTIELYVRWSDDLDVYLEVVEEL